MLLIILPAYISSGSASPTLMLGGLGCHSQIMYIGHFDFHDFITPPFPSALQRKVHTNNATKKNMSDCSCKSQDPLSTRKKVCSEINCEWSFVGKVCQISNTKNRNDTTRTISVGGHWNRVLNISTRMCAPCPPMFMSSLFGAFLPLTSRCSY